MSLLPATPRLTGANITLSLLIHRAIAVPPRRLGRASFAVIGGSWGLQGPASTSPSWLEKNFCKVLPYVPRSPASSPLHINPERQNHEHPHKPHISMSFCRFRKGPGMERQLQTRNQSGCGMGPRSPVSLPGPCPTHISKGALTSGRAWRGPAWCAEV